MRKILSIAFILFSIVGYSQTYDPTKATTAQKPYGSAQAFPTDARSYYYDGVNFLWRPFQNTTEVKTFLNLSKYRVGQFSIIVDSGGTLNSNGTFTGGAIYEYWFKNGTSDSNLVRKYSDGISGALLIANNLSDLNNAGTARTNLGLGTMSTQSTTAGGDAAGSTWPNITMATFGGQVPSYYLNYNNLTAKPTIPAQLNPTPSGLVSITGTYPNLTFTGNTPGFEATLFQNNTTSRQDSINIGAQPFTFYGTSALAIPVGNTAQRPAMSFVGYTRYNTDSLGIESYNGSIWRVTQGGSGSGSGISALTGDGTASGTGSVAFTLANVNTNIFTSNAFNKFSVNAKGLVTSATAVTTSDIIAALTYTPYNSTNPSGYISNITGLVTNGTNVTITGSGTSGSPYVINSSGGSGGSTPPNIGSGYRVYSPQTPGFKTLIPGTNITMDSTSNPNAITIGALGGGSGGNTNSNIGSGYRLAVPGTNNVKTLYCVGCGFDSTTNTNGITLTVSGGGGSGNSPNIYSDTNFVTLIVLYGESNAYGEGDDTFANPSELTAKALVQIYQSGSASFAAMNIGAANNYSGPTQHGLELELGNEVSARFGGRPVYMVKAGVPGSTINQWAVGSSNYTALIGRTDSALALIRSMGKTPVIAQWYLQGVNDAIIHTPAPVWRKATQQLFDNVRNRYGFSPITMARIMITTQTGTDADSLNRQMDTMAMVPNNYVYSIQTPSGAVGSMAIDSIRADGIHWQYLGLKAIANRMLNSMFTTSGYSYYYTGIYNASNSSWNIEGNALTDSTKFLGTTNSQSLIFKTKSSEAMRIDSFGRVGIFNATPQAKLDIGADIIINGENIGRGSGNVAGNTAMGLSVMGNNSTGTNLTGIGYLALGGNSTGSYNIGIGGQAGYGNTTGSTNTNVGFQTAISNIGSGNIFIGSQAAGSWATSLNNKLVIHDQSSGALIYGDMSTGQMQINSAATPTLTPSAALEIISTTRGLLLPRVTGAQMNAISSPASGLTVSCSDSSYDLCVYNGTVWVRERGTSSGGGAVSSVANSDGTLTISPTTGTIVASLALAHSNTWTGKQTQPAPIVTGTTSAGANDSVATIDPATGQVHWRSASITLSAAQGLYALNSTTFALGGNAFTLPDTIKTAGFAFLITGLPNKATPLSTDSVMIEDLAGKIWKLPVPSGGSGAVSTVSNSDGTLTITPTTGAVVGSLALAHANTWTGKQTQPAPIFTGTSSGANTDSVLTVNASTGQVNYKSAQFVDVTGFTAGQVVTASTTGGNHFVLTTPTSATNIYNTDGTLSANRTLSGATFSLSLGASGSQIGGLSIFSTGTTITGGKYISTAGSEILGAASTINNAVTAASGTVSNFSNYAFLAPTITSTNTSVTYNNPATVRIDNAPAFSTNSSASGTSYALDVVAGISHFGVGAGFSGIFDGVVSVNSGGVSNTSGLNIGASTTSRAAVNILSGVDPTGVVLTSSGMLWYNGTNLYFVDGASSGVKRDILNGIHNYLHTIFTPTTGSTTTIVDNQYNIVNPAGAIASLTYTFPASPSNNDVVYIKNTQTISAATYPSTVMGGIAAPTAGTLQVFTYDATANKWY